MAESPLGERVVALETEMRGHARSDDERYGRIENTTNQILTRIGEIGLKLDAGLTRVHDRVDEEAGKARHNLNNALQIITAEAAKARNADDVLAEKIVETDAKIGDQKVWILTNAVGVLLTALGAAWALLSSGKPVPHQ